MYPWELFSYANSSTPHPSQITIQNGTRYVSDYYMDHHKNGDYGDSNSDGDDLN